MLLLYFLVVLRDNESCGGGIYYEFFDKEILIFLIVLFVLFNIVDGFDVDWWKIYEYIVFVFL